MVFAFDKAVQCIPDFDGSHIQLQNFINVVDIFEPSFPVNAGIDADGNLTAAGEAYFKAEKELLVAVRLKLKGKALEQAADLVQKTWPETKAKLIKAFQVSNSLECISRMITTLHQFPGESFTAYKERADKINVYVRQLRNDYADRQLRIFFIAGLIDKDLVNFAKVQKVNTYLELTELLENAVNYQDEINFIRNSMQININNSCFRNNVPNITNNNMNGCAHASNFGNFNNGHFNGFHNFENVNNRNHNAWNGYINLQQNGDNRLRDSSLNNFEFNGSSDNNSSVANIPSCSNGNFTNSFNNHLNNDCCYNITQNGNNNCHNSLNNNFNNMLVPSTFMRNSNDYVSNENETGRSTFDQQASSMNFHPNMECIQNNGHGIDVQGRSTAFFTTNPVNEKGEQIFIKNENNLSFDNKSEVIHKHIQINTDNDSEINKFNVGQSNLSLTNKMDIKQSKVSSIQKNKPCMLRSSSESNQKVSGTHLLCTIGKTMNILSKKLGCSQKHSSKSNNKGKSYFDYSNNAIELKPDLIVTSKNYERGKNQKDKSLSRIRHIDNFDHCNQIEECQNEIRKPSINSFAASCQKLNQINNFHLRNPFVKTRLKTGVAPRESMKELNKQFVISDLIHQYYKDRGKIFNNTIPRNENKCLKYNIDGRTNVDNFNLTKVFEKFRYFGLPCLT
uniref:(northern house mosquito) hypothetical protein n=2 Tax=Culex pipiens TaxID=7175 RepID=A0A8D8PDN7_CULPI